MIINEKKLQHVKANDVPIFFKFIMIIIHYNIIFNFYYNTIV